MNDDIDLVRRMTDEVYVGGNLDVLDDFVADDFVDHDPVPGFPSDKQGLHQTISMVLAAMSKRTMEFDELMATNDGRVVESWAMTADHTGELFGVPATGANVRFRGIDIYRCADGKVTEHWGAVDLSDFMEKAQAAG